MAINFPREILNAFVYEGLCTNTDLLAVEIKPVDNSGGITDAVDGSSPNNAFEVLFRENDHHVFVKVNLSLHAYPCFSGEFHSLNAINLAVPNFAPAPRIVASFKSKQGAYIVTDFIPMSSNKPPESQVLFAQLLSRMHNHTPENGKFGFSVQTMIRPPPEYDDVGEVWMDTWEEYFRDVMMMSKIEKLRRNGREEDMECVKIALKVVELVIPKLIRILGKVKPTLVHGDLWKGNWAVDNHGKPIIFDPGCFYGHSEFELSIMRLWGDYTDEFWKAYHESHPRYEPYFNERQSLYQFWHYINHLYYFGSDEYRSAIIEVGSKLLKCTEDSG